MLDLNQKDYAMNALAPQDPKAWRGQFQNAMMDYRAQRPGFTPGMDPAAYAQQMLDYRMQRPERRDYRLGNVPGAPVAAPLAPAPLNPGATMQALQPQGMVGSSYGIPGMTAAASPFGLPRY